MHRVRLFTITFVFVVSSYSVYFIGGQQTASHADTNTPCHNPQAQGIPGSTQKRLVNPGPSKGNGEGSPEV